MGIAVLTVDRRPEGPAGPKAWPRDNMAFLWPQLRLRGVVVRGREQGREQEWAGVLRSARDRGAGLGSTGLRKKAF